MGGLVWSVWPRPEDAWLSHLYLGLCVTCLSGPVPWLVVRIGRFLRIPSLRPPLNTYQRGALMIVRTERALPLPPPLPLPLPLLLALT